MQVGASIDILAFYANIYDFTSIFTMGEPILTQLPQGNQYCLYFCKTTLVIKLLALNSSRLLLSLIYHAIEVHYPWHWEKHLGESGVRWANFVFML